MRRSYPKQLDIARLYSKDIVEHAAEHNQRTGQYLFNSFPVEITKYITASTFDPFHKEMSQYQIETWLLNHIIFNDSGQIVAVFNKNDLLWERNF